MFFRISPVRKHILYLLFIFLAACISREYDLELERFNPKLVITSLFNEGEKFKICITSSRPITSTEPFISIENAEVLLFENDIFMEYLHWVDSPFVANDPKGFYYSDNIKAQAGKKYRIEVSAPGYDPVSAVSIMPGETRIQYLNHKIIILQEDIFTYYYLHTNLSMENPVEIRNFYFFVSVKPYPGSSSEFFPMFRLNDPILGKLDEHSNAGFPLFSNEFIEQPEYEFYVRIRSDERGHVQSNRCIYYHLATLSEDAFEFLKTRNIQKDIDIRYSEPVNIYSNVTGGGGIFAAMNISCDSVFLE